MKLRKPSSLVVNWVSSCLYFCLSASNAATYIFTTPNCTTTIISLQSCALNAEYQHFILRFIKMSLLISQMCPLENEMFLFVPKTLPIENIPFTGTYTWGRCRKELMVKDIPRLSFRLLPRNLIFWYFSFRLRKVCWQCSSLVRVFFSSFLSGFVIAEIRRACCDKRVRPQVRRKLWG